MFMYCPFPVLDLQIHPLLRFGFLVEIRGPVLELELGVELDETRPE
jgi:hypothetical protein